jgi:hypothetical protein
MIEDILYKAEMLGIRKEVLEGVASQIKLEETTDKVLIYENVFNKLTKQIKQS